LLGVSLFFSFVFFFFYFLRSANASPVQALKGGIIVARLTRWRQIITNAEIGESVLVGYCYGHPILGERWIVTSRVQWLDRAKAQAQTCNTLYKLGIELDPREALPSGVQEALFNMLCRNLIRRGYKLDLEAMMKAIDEISRPISSDASGTSVQ
jgi:hypothetical protein